MLDLFSGALVAGEGLQREKGVGQLVLTLGCRDQLPRMKVRGARMGGKWCPAPIQSTALRLAPICAPKFSHLPQVQFLVRTTDQATLRVIDAARLREIGGRLRDTTS